MAHVIGKKIKGKTYYYLRENARVDGKSKVVSQQYLGSAEDVAAAMGSTGGGGVPKHSRHRGFGDVAAVWSTLTRLRVAETIDDVVGSEATGAAASVGNYIALMVLNRVVAPCSKLAFGDWWRSTAGERICNLRAISVDHRRFWDAMNAIDEDALTKIEQRICRNAIAEYDLDISALALDMTNFATFIDSANERNTLAQRGHAKQKRNDLRIVGLGLVVTRDGAIPIGSHVYAGDRPDVTQFATMIEVLAARYRQAGGNNDLCVVYDAGQGSKANYKTIETAGIGFVSSVPPSEHRDLLAITGDAYHDTDIDGVRAHETTADVYGAKRRIVLCHSDGLHEAQTRGFDQTVAKATGRLDELADRLARGKTRRPKGQVETDISKLLASRWVSRVIRWDLTGEQPADLRLQYHIDETARDELETEIFGKRILVTDRTGPDWTTVDVIRAYRSQSEVEAVFRQMKDPHVVGVSPMFHWTDQKIRVQLFGCVTALMTANLMAREIERSNLAPMSVRTLLHALTDIEETVLVYPSTGGRPRVRRILTEMDSTQQKLFDHFRLDRYKAPR